MSAVIEHAARFEDCQHPDCLCQKSSAVPLFVPPNSELLAISRLYLEKFDQLEAEDRELYRQLLRGLALSPAILTGDKR